MEHEIGPYKLIGVGKDSSYEPEVLMLDSNVAIDIECFYMDYKDLAERKVTKEQVRDLFRSFPWSESKRLTVDINYGWVSCENAWCRDGSFADARVRRLRWAVERVIHWDAERIEREFSQRRPPSARDKYWPEKAPLPEPDQIKPPFPGFFSCYASVLKLCNLHRTRAEWEQRGVRWAVETYLDWIRYELGVAGGFEQALGVSLFVGDPEDQAAVKRLLKLKGSPDPDKAADRAWSAAWDISMLRAAEMRHYGHSSGPQATYLVTRDKDPWLLRRRSEIRAVIDMGDSVSPFMGSSWDPEKSSIKCHWTDEEFSDLMQIKPREALERRFRPAGSLFQQVFAALSEVEAQMGLQRSTATAYLPKYEAMGAFAS